MPESLPEGAMTMSVRRGPEPGARPVVAFDVGSATGVVVVAADGKPLPLRLAEDKDGGMAVSPADTPALLAAMRRAAGFELRRADGKRAGRVSLKGASAALLYMDEQQRRVGPVTALAKPGSKPASAIPGPPARPLWPPSPSQGLTPCAKAPGATRA